jgi:lysophospholipase L1-like esterase
MRIKYLLIALLFAGRTVMAGQTAYYDARVDTFRKDKNVYDVVMVGDSLTERGNWSTFFPAIKIANRGISGDSIQGVLARLDTIHETGAKLVFVMIGVNDLLSGGMTAAQVIPRYKLLLDRMHVPGIKLFVESTLYTDFPGRGQTNEEIEAVNRAIADFCHIRNIGFIDLNHALSIKGHLRTDVSIDHLHLNALGYSLWKRLIAEDINGVAR